MLMYVYIGRRSTVPIVIESNLAWALPYWTARKAINDKLRMEIK